MAASIYFVADSRTLASIPVTQDRIPIKCIELVLKSLDPTCAET